MPERVALGLTALLIEETVSQRMRHGLTHEAARDGACRLYADEMVRQAGRPAADAAIRAVHCLRSDEFLNGPERALIRERERIDTIAMHEAARGKPLGWFNRLCVRITGMPFLCVLVVAGGVLGSSGSAAAREAPSRWRALAECGVAKGADYERKCRQFSRTERSTWRAYDGPGAGAPREWELPRPYD